MFINIAQIILLSLAALSATLLFGLVATFRAWKAVITSPSESGLGYHFKSKSHYQAYTLVTETAQKFLNPAALIWVGSASASIWIIIRVVLSFTL